MSPRTLVSWAYGSTQPVFPHGPSKNNERSFLPLPWSLPARRDARTIHRAPLLLMPLPGAALSVSPTPSSIPYLHRIRALAPTLLPLHYAHRALSGAQVPAVACGQAAKRGFIAGRAQARCRRSWPLPGRTTILGRRLPRTSHSPVCFASSGRRRASNACFKSMFQVFQIFHKSIASVSYECCKRRSGCCICCNTCTYMF
jgi:hypothetical protein